VLRSFGAAIYPEVFGIWPIGLVIDGNVVVRILRVCTPDETSEADCKTYRFEAY
jgi:hypothetical protein